jgi:glycosyltransferase involved in cell wall biosynthesis
MNDKVAVLIPTYNRPYILTKCVNALINSILEIDNVHIFIGNDGDQEVQDWGPKTTVWTNPSGSLGANLNRLIRLARNKGFHYALQMDDDHILKKEFSLESHIEAMNKDSEIGWVRLWGVDDHRYTANLWQGYWRVKWDSKELYITSNRPHIKRLDFHDYYGYYPEGLKLGETEESFCHQTKNIGKENLVGMKVCVPLCFDDKNSWDHIGHSWQQQGF